MIKGKKSSGDLGLDQSLDKLSHKKSNPDGKDSLLTTDSLTKSLDSCPKTSASRRGKNGKKSRKQLVDAHHGNPKVENWKVNDIGGMVGPHHPSPGWGGSEGMRRTPLAQYQEMEAWDEAFQVYMNHSHRMYGNARQGKYFQNSNSISYKETQVPVLLPPPLKSTYKLTRNGEVQDPGRLPVRLMNKLVPIHRRLHELKTQDPQNVDPCEDLVRIIQTKPFLAKRVKARPRTEPDDGKNGHGDTKSNIPLSTQAGKKMPN